MVSSKLSRVTGCAQAMAVAGLVAACGSRPVAPQRPLPSYSFEEAALFDDQLAPQVFGYGADRFAESDPRFGERAARADQIILARVATVSRAATAGSGASYQVAFVPLSLLSG